MVQQLIAHPQTSRIGVWLTARRAVLLPLAFAGTLALAFKDIKTRFCIVSFTSDWLFPTAASRAIVHALNAGGASVSFVEIDTDKGHDAFLLDLPELFTTTSGFLESSARAFGLKEAKRA
jgi:homoserine O-acetyltransferase